MKLIRTYIESQISEIKNFKDMIEFQKNKYGNNIAIDYELDGNIIKKSYCSSAGSCPYCTQAVPLFRGL